MGHVPLSGPGGTLEVLAGWSDPRGARPHQQHESDPARGLARARGRSSGRASKSPTMASRSSCDAQRVRRDALRRRGVIAARGPRYHNLHPFHRRMDAGELTREELQRWVANRFYYQKCIPLKDAAILANCPEVESGPVGPAHHRPRRHGRGTGRHRVVAAARRGARRPARRAGLGAAGPARGALRGRRLRDFARRKPWIEAVASSLTELFGPAAIRVRLEALERHYPWIDPAGLEYFRARLVQAPRDAVRARSHRGALPDARAAGRRRRGAALQDRDAVGAAGRDRARRHAAAGPVA